MSLAYANVRPESLCNVRPLWTPTANAILVCRFRHSLTGSHACYSIYSKFVGIEPLMHQAVLPSTAWSETSYMSPGAIM